METGWNVKGNKNKLKLKKKMGFYSHLDSNSQGSFSKAHVVSPLAWYHKDLQCLLVQPFISTTQLSAHLDCVSLQHVSDSSQYASQSRAARSMQSPTSHIPMKGTEELAFKMGL